MITRFLHQYIYDRALELARKTGLMTCCFACAFFLSLAVQPCMAAGPDHLSLQGFTVLEEHDQLVVRAPIDIEPREAMRHMLRDGAEVLLTCTALLERERTLLPRSTVSSTTAAMVLSYDPLSRQYLLSVALPEEIERLKKTREEQEKATEKTGERAEENTSDTAPEASPDAKDKDTTLVVESPQVQTEPLYGHRDFAVLMDNTLGRLRMPLGPTSALDPDDEYYATVRVELRHNKIPPWLSQSLFFWSWDVVPSIEFSQALRGE